MRHAFYALLLALAGHAAAGPAVDGELTLELLMRHMATTSGVVAEFREVKELSLLVAPLETRGRLYFAPPDRLARITDAPGATRLVIAGDRLEFHDEAGGDRVDLTRNPVARQFVDNLIVLFNGDLPELRRRYDVGFRAEADDWELTLQPRRAPVSDLIRSITLAGKGPALREMRMLETDGDRTRTLFSRVVVDHEFGADELERHFSIPGGREKQ